LELPKASQGIGRSLYYYKGDGLKLGEKVLPAYHAVDVRPDMKVTLEAGEADAKILVLQGKPINEPVAQYGPFVMNYQAEIKQAFLDFQETQFGGWPWDEQGPVHDRSKGRFAYHADGKREERN
jgi:redox-sensitive bicupin YhaK (pirin superfamily)